MIPRQAGQYAREQFRKRFVPHLVLVLSGIVLALVGATLAMINLLSDRRGMGWFFSLLAAALLCGVLSTRYERGDLAWVPWLKGLRGERLVASALEPLENEGFRVAHDLETPSGNIDHVVVGPTGVFAIEVKHWTGHLGKRGGQLVLNGWPKERVVTQTLGEAMEIRRRLRLVGMTCWVEALVVSTKGTVEHGRLGFHHVTLLPVDALADFITDRRARLTDVEIARAVAVILRGDNPLIVRAISLDAPIGTSPSP